jgi:hypothetical protein
MRLKFTILLLALNIVTFGLVLFLSQRAEHAGMQTGGLSDMIGREVIEADRIELSGKQLEAPRVLERDGASWHITQPMQWSANYFAINRILNQLQFLEEEASFSIDEIKQTGQSLADYGLDDPWLKLTIAQQDQSIQLSIGTRTEIGNNFYLLGPGGEHVFVVSRQVIDSLLIDLGDLRNREIFNIPVFEINALSLQTQAPEAIGNGDFKVRLARTNSGWMFEAPLSAEADPTRVANTISTLTAAKVVEFKEQETSDPILLGLENPSMRVTLHGNKRRQTLIIGNKDPAAAGNPTYFARLEGNPTVFTVAAEPFDELHKAQDALRERSFMSFDPNALTSIDLSAGELQIRLQKLETGIWQVIERNAGADIQPRHADPEVIDKLKHDLLTLRASGFAVDSPNPTDLDRLGFNQPRRSITLTQHGGEQTTLLLAHPESENEELYARNDRAEYIYQVDRRATLRMLPLNAAYYRNRTLETLPKAAQISALTLENLTTGEVVFAHTLDAKETSWQDALRDTPESERDAILILLTTIRHFSVKSYLLDRYENEYPVDSETTRPWVYRLSAELLLPGDATDRSDTRSYVFTDRMTGTIQVGGSELHDSIFELPQHTLDALYSLTETMRLPPEATGAAIPELAPIAPVAEPAPTNEVIAPGAEPAPTAESIAPVAP